MDFKQQAEKNIELAVGKYREEVAKIEGSLDPRYKDADFKAQAIREKQEELEKTVRQQTREFEERKAEVIADLEAQAAQSYIKPMPSDKELADSIVSEFKAQMAFSANDDARGEALSGLENRLHHLSDRQLKAIHVKLPEVLNSVSDEDKASKRRLRDINTALNQLETPEQERYTEAKQSLENGVDRKYRHLKMTHKSFSHLEDNMHRGQQIGQVE